MKTCALFIAAALAVVGATAPCAVSAQTVSPRLAANVKPPPAPLVRPAERLVVANPTPIFSDLSETSTATGHLDRVGQPVQTIAEVKGWDWLLVGKDGVGIGYVPRSLLMPGK